MKSAINLSNNEELETPPKLFAKACRDLEIYPTLDVCATRKNTKCHNFITKWENAMVFEWNQDFFMNPPYPKRKKDKNTGEILHHGLGAWIEKAYNEVKKHDVNGLSLIFAKTSAPFWHKFIQNQAEFYLIKDRINFYYKGKPATDNKGKIQPAPDPSIFVVWRSESWIRVFGKKRYENLLKNWSRPFDQN